jgi:tRNA dimethylallyltransferase
VAGGAARAAGAQAVRAVLIAGPTASGKSEAALDLAVRFGGTVINADSMQVYRELGVLTARPGPEAERRAPHRLYGVVSVAERYSVGRWLQDAAAAIEAARTEKRLPVLVGGTGLYFKALTEGLAPVPDIPPGIRAAWRRRAARLSPGALHRALAERDPDMAARLPQTDPQRLLRALEVVEATGISLADWQQDRVPPVLAPETAMRIVIAPDREALYAEIERRFDRALAAGAVEEVQDLLQMNLDGALSAMRAHGVPEIAHWLRGDCSREQAVSQAKTAIRRYAKRQLTWARRFMQDWHWFADAAAAVDWADAALHTKAAG